ncbi:MAG: hypothetical protein ACLFSB_06740 [Chitinispirillaceae bacterium]
MSYPSFSLEQLKAVTAKHSDIIISETDSGALLFTTYGARLLGLFPERNGHNLLWVYAHVEESMRTGQWLTGGERLWIAPEKYFYYENPRDFEGFHVPAGIDPGSYAHLADLTFGNEFSVLNYSTNETYDECIQKRVFSQLEDPYQTGLAYAGVSITDMVSFPAPDLDIAAWSLSQVYTCGPERNGTVLFPMKSSGRILSYFSPIPPDRAEVCNQYGRFKIDSNAWYKMAIRPEDTKEDNPCKLVYVSPDPTTDAWHCLIKRSDDIPLTQDQCVDAPRENPQGEKGAIQSYNNAPGYTGTDTVLYGELELQLKKGASGNGKTVSEATHELLGYTASKEDILSLAKKALGTDSIPELYV